MSLRALPDPDAAMVRRRNDIVRKLARLVPADRVISDEDGRRAFETDALTAYRRMPLAVVLPTGTDEVSRILSFCDANGIKVVARGAGTSLSGGALPAEDAIVLGVSRMSRVLAVDYENRTARVEAGITNLAISEAVAKDGFLYAPDPSSQLACTLAGNIAMNAGGAHGLKYGVTTNNVLGVTLVMMNGEIVEIGGDALDPPGYDLLALVSGSEGQIGVVTEATVRILKAPEGARPMLLGFASSAAACACVSAILGSGPVPVAIELMDRTAVQVCERFARAGYPLDVEALLIVEVEGSDGEIETQLRRIGEIARAFDPRHVRVSQSPEESKAIWKGCKSAFGAIGQISDYHCMDGTVPPGRLSEVLAEIAAVSDRYQLRVANMLHAGDGNLQSLILYDSNDPVEMERAELCGAEILQLCVEAGGCLTGEHGVGIGKRDLMPAQFSAVDLAVQKRVKSVFDPKWLLNPAKVFPLDDVPAS